MKRFDPKLFSVILIVLASLPLAGQAFAVPLPRPKPPQLSAPAPQAPSVAKPDASMPQPSDQPQSVEEAKPPEPSACQLRLAEGLAAFKPLPDLSGPRGCGATDVVSLEGVILRDKTLVPLKPAATLRCSMAEAVVQWVREDVAAAVPALGATLHEIDNYDSYDCRGRNRVATAKISEHGLANALDIRGFKLANGFFAGLTDRALARPFRESIKQSLCVRFSTILGPGSDGYHETHVHLDLAQRRGGYKICQWDVLDPAPEIPLPRPRPPEAPQAEEVE